MRPSRLIPFALVLTACSAVPGLGRGLAGPTPLPNPPVTPLPAAEVSFWATPPAGTTPQTRISLVLLDEITGFPFYQQDFPMQRTEDGRYQVTLTQPVGSVLHYRYRRVSPGTSEEFTARGEAVDCRLAHVTGPGVVTDIIAAWSDAPYAGPTGRIIGHIREAASGTPLPEILVAAGGRQTFTDAQGYFRLDDLPPGTHTLVALSLDGAHRTWQQEALVAAESATPAEFTLVPSQPVTVSFEVTVPSDTPLGGPLRLAGNLRSLGNMFSPLEGGVRLSSVRMPTLTLVDATHYILIVQLYAGTDLRYVYTLGDGLWNAERSADGDFLVRQLIVPDHDLIVEDVVATWHSSDLAPVTLTVVVPNNTPPAEAVSIQFHGGAWSEPLPMIRRGPLEWSFTLFGPFDLAPALGYRYCRNHQCGAADDAATSGPSVIGRPLTPSRSSVSIVDTVQAWQSWGNVVPSIVVPGGLTARPGIEVGVEFSTAYRPTWSPFIQPALANIAGGGATAVIFSPVWVAKQNSPIPVIAFDPAAGPFLSDLSTWVREAHRLGLSAGLHPRVRSAEAAWWSAAPRDLGWWDVWFESYRSLVLTAARLAAETGAEELILGGPEVAPALPGGLLSDGTPSGAPADAEGRWRSLIADVRALYGGRLVFEAELGRSLVPIPPFLDEFDQVHVYWHAPLGEGTTLTPGEMQAASEAWIQQALIPLAARSRRPLVLSVEYLSVDGGATGCAPAPDGSCRPPSAFDSGAVVDPELPVDLAEQAEAFNAVLSAALAHPEIAGAYARGYNPAVGLQDKSSSVHGKPAQDVLWYWFSNLSGR